MLHDPELLISSPIELAWYYSLYSKSYQNYKNQTFSQRIETNFLFKQLQYAITPEEKQFLIKISHLLNIYAAVVFYLEIFQVNTIPFNSSYY